MNIGGKSGKLAITFINQSNPTYSNGIYRVNKSGEGKLAIKYSKRHKGIINLFYTGINRKLS